jgi:hypothetical protein
VYGVADCPYQRRRTDESETQAGAHSKDTPKDERRHGRSFQQLNQAADIGRWVSTERWPVSSPPRLEDILTLSAWSRPPIYSTT